MKFENKMSRRYAGSMEKVVFFGAGEYGYRAYWDTKMKKKL